LLFILLCPIRLFSEEILAPYRSLIGSQIEKQVLQFARRAIINELISTPSPSDPKFKITPLPPTGLFLTLMKGKKVRACIGGFTPSSKDLLSRIKDLSKEVIYKDLRDRPISIVEIDELSIVISFVNDRKEIPNPYDIDFSNEGLYVAQNGRGFVLLPGETRTLEYGLNKIIERNNFDPKEPLRYVSFKTVSFDERSQ
jgi:AMMECR1 domain-containing protein